MWVRKSEGELLRKGAFVSVVCLLNFYLYRMFSRLALIFVLFVCFFRLHCVVYSDFIYFTVVKLTVWMAKMPYLSIFKRYTSSSTGGSKPVRVLTRHRVEP